MDTIEAIERATLAAVPPQRVERWGDWLLAFDDGAVGRSHSAVPLRHAAPASDLLPELERRYAEARLPLVLRVPQLEMYGRLENQLASSGYRRSKPTQVQLGHLADLAAASDVAMQVQVDEAPGADWEQVFLGEGFDPVDGASRLAILRRGRNSLFASARRDGRIVAVGSAGLAHGWCGFHGMRTLPGWRGRGLATSVLAALAAAALQRGMRDCFLQVEAANGPARALYERLGFRTAWTYAYWKA